MSDGTATSSDCYTSESGTLTISAGETSKAIQVSINDDSIDDDKETLTLTLSIPSGAEIGDAQAKGTIEGDDTDSATSMAVTSDNPLTGFAVVDSLAQPQIVLATPPTGYTLAVDDDHQAQVRPRCPGARGPLRPRRPSDRLRRVANDPCRQPCSADLHQVPNSGRVVNQHR